jgi:hypothetical protein
MQRQWQTLIEVSNTAEGYRETEKKCTYGETVDVLLSATRAYLQERKPLYFSNIGDHVAGRFQYYYSDGELLRDDLSDDGVEEVRGKGPLSEGWWCKEQVAPPHSLYQYEYDGLSYIKNFERAIRHFIRWAVIPEKGPDYQSKVLDEGGLRMHLLKRILRENDEHVVNDLLRKGWYVVDLEHQEILGTKDELVNHQATFVLGHHDLEAAQKTFDAKYYHTYLKQYR